MVRKFSFSFVIFFLFLVTVFMCNKSCFEFLDLRWHPYKIITYTITAYKILHTYS
jgi:hypothetical protein